MENNIKQAKLHAKYAYRRSLRSGGKDLPWLNLTGVWLEQAGFPVGQRIEIRVENKHLTIIAL